MMIRHGKRRGRPGANASRRTGIIELVTASFCPGHVLTPTAPAYITLVKRVRSVMARVGFDLSMNTRANISWFAVDLAVSLARMPSFGGDE